MISEKKRMQIANICYANVAGQFAMFNNPKYRGPTFTWDRFPDDCERLADTWMMIAHVRGDKETINQTAKTFAKEIAEILVRRMRD